MTIIIGTLVIAGDIVNMPPPGGFNSVGGLRLSNLCDSSVIVQNLQGTDQNQQLIQPNQQNVYAISNIGRTPTLSPTGADTTTTIVDNVTVEWSTDPQVDFVGVYPTQISPPAQVIAEAIFNKGVPLVLVEDQLFSGTIAGSASETIDTTKYGSLILGTSNAGALAHELTLLYQFTSPSGTVTGQGTIKWPTGILSDSVEIPVTGTSFRVQNADAVNATPTLVILGTNRQLASEVLYNNATAGGIATFNASSAFTGGSTTPLTNAAGSTEQFLASGPTLCTFTIPNATAKGQFQLVDPDGNAIDVTDTSETGWHGVAGSAITMVMYKTITIPNDGVRYTWQYVSNTAPGSTIIIKVQCLQ